MNTSKEEAGSNGARHEPIRRTDRTPFEPVDSRLNETWAGSVEELFDYLAEKQAAEEFGE